MAFTFVTVVAGPYEASDGSPSTGAVRYRLTAPMTLDDVTLGVGEVTAAFDDTGTATAIIAANNDDDVTPPNVSYEVTVAVDGCAPSTRFVRLPKATSPVNLATL